MSDVTNDDETFRLRLFSIADVMDDGRTTIVLRSGKPLAVYRPVHVGLDFIEFATTPGGGAIHVPLAEISYVQT